MRNAKMRAWLTYRLTANSAYLCNGVTFHYLLNHHNVVSENASTKGVKVREQKWKTQPAYQQQETKPEFNKQCPQILHPED